MSLFKEAAERGDAEAQYQLGGSYRWGENGVAKDDKESEKWYRKAADQGHPVALGVCYQKGWGVTKDDNEAAKWYRQSAEQGNAFGQNALGARYQNGEGVTKDLDEAVKWYRKSAEQGNAGAQYNLGICYRYGEGVTKNLNEAAKWYRKSAEQGNAFGQNSLGNCYRYGEGVDKDLNEAVTWYRKSAEQGNANAQNNLGWCYENGQGVPKDLNEAVKWYRKSAEQGNANAQNNLGDCYRYGEGVTKDLDEAVKWFRKSAEQGNAFGQNNLGVCYGMGEGVTKDLSEAVKWFRKSAEQGNAFGQNNLGLCYENGWGVTKDLDEAAKWYRKSAEQANANGQVKLGVCYQNGEGVTKDLNEAAKWYRKATEQGNKNAFDNIQTLARQDNQEAQIAVAACCENGWGTHQDIDQSVKWYHKAAEGGSEEALKKLKSHAETGNRQACKAILELADQGHAKAVSLLEQLAQKDSKAMVHIILQGFAQKVAQLKGSIASSVKLSLSHPNVQDVDGNTLLMNHLLHLGSDVLAEPEVSDLLKAAFNASPWHTVNRHGRSLAEIILDDRVPTIIRDHARAVMEATLADSSADPALRSAAARALHRHDPLIPPNSSYFNIRFNDLRIFARDSSDMPHMQELITATEESARRLPQNTLDQLQSLIGMLQSLNTPEMQHISRLERHLPGLEKRLLAIKETHRWLSKYGSIQANESVETDTLERIQDHRDLLGRQLRETEPIFAEVNATLPQLDANLSSLFPQIEGRADRISPTQLNDILIFIRQHFGNIAWHQQAVVTASQTLMEALNNYATSVRSVQGDLDIHHSFMKFFLAHAGKVCSDLIPAARRHVEEIAVIRSEFNSRSDIRQMADELKTIPQNLESQHCNHEA